MQKRRDFKIIENRNNSVLVRDDIGERTAVAKHEDEAGEYILNGNLKKQYIAKSEWETKPVEVVPEPPKTPAVPKNKKGRWTFETTIYAADGFCPGRTYTKTFKADTLKEAEQKLEDNYSHIFDSILISAYDADGNDVYPF